MKKLVKLLKSRMFWTLVSFAVELFLLCKVAVNHFSGPFFQYTQFFRIFTFAVGIYVAVIRKVNPSYKLSWLLLFMLMPRLGGLLYIFFGEKNLSRKKLQKIKEANEKYQKASGQITVADRSKIEQSTGQVIDRFCNYVKEYGEGEFWTDSTVKYFSLGDYAFEAMLKDMESAEKFIFLEFFIIDEGEALERVLEILKQKVKEGVEVRILYDDIGSINTLSPGFCDEMEQVGIKASKFNRLGLHLVNSRLNYRDHRKIVSIDGNIAYTGGFNLADEYINRKIRFGHWKDSAIRIEGPAVWNLTQMFLENWGLSTDEISLPDFYLPTVKKQSDGFIQPFGTNPLQPNTVGKSVFLHAIACAKNYIWISTPYLILDDEIVHALVLSAKSGVDVRIVTPHIPDKKTVFALTRANYDMLLEYGVKIYEYAPGFIHAKMFVSDDINAYVGTINMDYRSFFLHFECGALLYGCSAIQDIKADFRDIFSVSLAISPAKHSFFERIRAVALKTFAPLM